MDELQIKVSNTLGEITTNFEEIEANLKMVLADYKGIIVTEDTLKESKKDLAQLRKIIKDIEDSRKAIKREWDKPYTAFETRCKLLEAMVEEPITEINSQVAIYEQKKVDEKKEHFLELYSENIEEYEEFIPFEATLSDKWKNVSYADKDFLYDLSEKKVRIKTDLAAIKALHSEIEDEVIAAYKGCGNTLTAAIQKNSDYLNAKELAKKKLEEDKKAEAEKKAVEEQIAAIPDEGFMNPPEFFESDHVMTFKVIGDENIQKVKEFLDFAEIKYEEV